MSQSTVDNTVEIRLPEGSPDKFERERRAFYRLLPALRETHAGHFVAIHDEKVVDSGLDQLEVALRVQRRVGSVPIYVHLVSDETQEMCRSGIARDLGQRGIRP